MTGKRIGILRVLFSAIFSAACLVGLLFLGGCAKKLAEKDFQWNTQCEQMLLKGADGVRRHHDCYGRCAGHHLSFCEGRCVLSFQGTMGKMEAQAYCKKEVASFVRKKCQGFCEMSETQMQEHKLSFIQGIARGKDPNEKLCPCNKRDARNSTLGNSGPQAGRGPEDNIPGFIPVGSGGVEDELVSFQSDLVDGPDTPYDLPWYHLGGASMGSQLVPQKDSGTFSSQGVVNIKRRKGDPSRRGMQKEAMLAFASKGASDLPWINERGVNIPWNNSNSRDQTQEAEEAFLKGYRPIGTFSFSQDQGQVGGNDPFISTASRGGDKGLVSDRQVNAQGQLVDVGKILEDNLGESLQQTLQGAFSGNGGRNTLKQSARSFRKNLTEDLANQVAPSSQAVSPNGFPGFNRGSDLYGDYRAPNTGRRRSYSANPYGAYRIPR